MSTPGQRQDNADYEDKGLEMGMKMGAARVWAQQLQLVYAGVCLHACTYVCMYGFTCCLHWSQTGIGRHGVALRYTRLCGFLVVVDGGSFVCPAPLLFPLCLAVCKYVSFYKCITGYHYRPDLRKYISNIAHRRCNISLSAPDLVRSNYRAIILDGSKY